ncbi:MAG TPA: hypothetical protein VFX44_10510 [Solirubrobacterales bacterium]|nr:hypothetical protein [Solirubrobacterales bacterium]
MTYLKMFGLAFFVAGALMAFVAGPASATELTCESSMCAVGTAIHLRSEGYTFFDSTVGTLECEFEIEGATANTGGSGETANVNISVFSVILCTDGAKFTVVQKGSFEVHGIAGTANGTLTSSGAEWTTETSGTHCLYRTSATDIGTLTGSSTTSSEKATLDISATIPRVGGRSGAFCGSATPWTGSFEVTAPKPLNID